MSWEVEFTSEFGEWWESLTADEQESVAHVVDLLEARGVTLDSPYSSPDQRLATSTDAGIADRASRSREIPDMARKFSELRAKMSPESRARVAARTQAALKEMPLNELRRARDLTQVSLAKAMGTSQGEVSKIEQRADLYVSTLRNYLEAMGGELEIVARFPDGAVKIMKFGELSDVSAR